MKIRNFIIGLAVVGLIFLFNGEIFAHGTGYRQINLKAIPLEFFYSTGEKMSYREVKVFSPKDSKFPIQTGRTDEEGRFAFIPDVSGDWKVIVRDEEGHQCEAKINLTSLSSDDDISPYRGHNVARGSMAKEAILGVSLIFNIAAFVKLFCRSKNKNAH
ncbi:MAG: hypothetical protein IJP69_10325 [Synergistaceae bacterium]|nr:hypothetical protein [Synergistaceae bacterium]